MNKQELKKMMFISLSIYIFFGFISCIWGVHTSDIVYRSVGNYRYAYFWMDPQFSYIQFGNNMIIFAPLISSVIAISIRIKDNMKYYEYILFLNLINIIGCSSVTLVCLFIANRYHAVLVEFNTLYHSIQMIIAFYLFIIFWSLFSYLIKLITGKTILSIIIVFIIQLSELYLIPQLGWLSVLKYLPTTLARQLIIKQFPFWIKGTWCEKLNVFSYGNIAPIYASNYNLLNPNLFYTYSMLLLYLVIEYIIFIFIKKRRQICIKKANEINNI